MDSEKIIQWLDDRREGHAFPKNPKAGDRWIMVPEGRYPSLWEFSRSAAPARWVNIAREPTSLKAMRRYVRRNGQ